MDELGNDTTAQSGATRRGVLLGATTLAAATAVATAVGGTGVAHAGGAAGPMDAEQLMCNYTGIGQFAISSFQWGVGRGISDPVSGSAQREATPPSLSEITITKYMDARSPLLLAAALNGGPAHVTISALSAKGAPIASYELGGVMISGYSTSSGGALFSESLSLNFETITYGAHGASTSWDRATATPM